MPQRVPHHVVPLVLALAVAVLAALPAAVPSAAAQAPARTEAAIACDADEVQPPTPVRPDQQRDGAFLRPIGTYKAGGFDASGAEIVTFDPDTARIFTVNGATQRVDVLDASDPTSPRIVGCLDLRGEPTSVAVLGGGVAAVAYQAIPKTDPGFVTVLDGDARALATVRVGSTVDAITVTPDGRRLLTSDEGEIPDDYMGDPATIPVGSVSVIDLPDDLATLSQDDVTVVPLSQLDDADLGPHVRRSPLIPTFGQDAEPEYVVVASDSRTAYVALQESSAIAVLDLDALAFTRVIGLSVVDHALPGAFISPNDRPLGEPARALDPRDASIPDSAFARDENTGRASHRVVGMPMPDGIALLESQGRSFLLTAEEGDAREWGPYVDVARVSQLGSGGRPALCAGAYSAAERATLARLTVSLLDGIRPGATCIEQLHALGTRGMGIYDAETGDRVWHSGDDFERAGLAAHPRFLNSNHREASYLTRSDDKGPEPEYVEVGTVGDRTYAFVGLERISAIAVYDVTDPTAPTQVDYVLNRDFDRQLVTGSDPLVGDLGPEGLDFVPAEDSATRRPLLIVGNEVSHTTTIWEVDVDPLPVIAFDAAPGRIQPGRTVPLRFSVVDAAGRTIRPAGLRAVVTAPDGGVSDADVQRQGRDGLQVLVRTVRGLTGSYRVDVLDGDGARLGRVVLEAR